METNQQCVVITDPSAPIPAGWTVYNFDPQQHFLEICRRAAFTLAKGANAYDYGCIGLEFLDFGNDEEDLDFAVACLTKAVEGGDWSSIEELVGIYENPNSRLYNKSLAEFWFSKLCNNN